MSRRKLQWKQRMRQAGSLDKILPGDAKGSGEWLQQGEIPGRTMPLPANTEGSTVSKTMGSRKEQLVRQWTKQ